MTSPTERDTSDTVSGHVQWCVMTERQNSVVGRVCLAGQENLWCEAAGTVFAGSRVRIQSWNKQRNVKWMCGGGSPKFWAPISSGCAVRSVPTANGESVVVCMPRAGGYLLCAGREHLLLPRPFSAGRCAESRPRYAWERIENFSLRFGIADAHAFPPTDWMKPFEDEPGPRQIDRLTFFVLGPL